MNKLKELRTEKGLTQQEVASAVGISIRSYKYYENDESKRETIKYKYIIDKLESINKIDEEHGILTLEDIKKKCGKVLEKYEVDYCILFGSYSKGNANEMSDVDLLISTKVAGLKFYGLIEEIRQVLHKKVDVLDLNQLKDNFELTTEILRDGIKIFG